MDLCPYLLEIKAHYIMDLKLDAITGWDFGLFPFVKWIEGVWCEHEHF